MTRTEFLAVSRSARLTLRDGAVQHFGAFFAQRLADGYVRFFRDYGPGFSTCLIVEVGHHQNAVRRMYLTAVRAHPPVPLPR